MARLSVFNNVSLDGYFTDAQGRMDFAHQAPNDEEWRDFASSNSKGEGMLLFGRITYDMMAGYWPTPAAAQSMPAVADKMNRSSKIVVSRSMAKAEWKNTRLIKSDFISEIKKLKEGEEDMVILGSGTLVAQLTPHRLIDEYQFVVNPVVLGKGRTLFEGMAEPVRLKLEKTRSFKNGNTVLWYKA